MLYQIKTRGAAERFISEKTQIASILNGVKNDPFYTHLVFYTHHFIPSLFAKKLKYRCCISRENRGKSFVKIYVCFIAYKNSFMALISFVSCHELLMSFLSKMKIC